MEWLAALGPLLQLAGSGAGAILSGKDEEAARAYLLRLLDESESMGVPELERLNPQQLGRSAAGDISADPELVAAQRLALAMLADVTDDGITAADRAEMARLGNESSRIARANQAGIRDQLAARGMQGSGISYALQQQAGQDATQRASQGALDLNAQAMRQRLQAVRDTGSLAGQMRGQDYEERARSAAARDEVERFNAAARERSNAYNASLPAQRFDMSQSRTRGISDALAMLSGQSSQAAQRTRELGAGLGRAGSEMFRGYSYRQPSFQGGVSTPSYAAEIEDLKRRGLWR